MIYLHLRFQQFYQYQDHILSLLMLFEAVSRYYFKLLAYKDEYEVARMHTSPEFR